MMKKSYTKLITILFSKVKQKGVISQQALEAVWAQAIYKEVASSGQSRKRNASQANNQILNPVEPRQESKAQTPQASDQNAESSKEIRMPLVEQILNIELPDTINLVCKQPQKIKSSKNQIMKIFQISKGAELPLTLINTQKRIKSSLNPNKKITFYPNYFTAPIVFGAIQRNSEGGEKQMIVGKKGISKSMSFILAWYLCSKITRFRFKQPKVAQQLIDLKLLDPLTPKLLYFSFTPEIIRYQSVINLLKAQCPELASALIKIKIDFSQKSENQRIYILGKLIEKINDTYSDKGINCMVIFDQINTLASSYTQFNRKQASTAKILQDQNQKSPLYRKVETHQHILKQLSSFGLCIYNSSKNIESALLEKPTEKNPFTFYFNHHSFIRITQCEFNINKIGARETQEIYLIIWYEIGKHLLETERKLLGETCIKTCKDLAQGAKFTSFITPLTIRTIILEYFGKNRDAFVERLKNNTENQIKAIIEEIKRSGKKDARQKMLNYVLDQSQSITTKINVMFSIWQALRHLNQSQNKNVTSLHVKDQIKFMAPISEILSLFDKDVFELVGSDRLQLLLTYEEYNELMMEVMYQILSNHEQSELLLDAIINWNDGALKGKTIQMLLIMTLTTENPIIYFSLQGFNKSFQINGKETFMQFCPDHEKLSNLSKLFALAHQKDIACCFGKPVKLDGQYAPTSPSFDFIIVEQPVKNKDTFIVYSFDITVNKEFSDIKEKGEDAQKLIRKILGTKLEGVEIQQWRHTVICLPIHLTKFQEKFKSSDEEKRIIIRSSDLRTMKFLMPNKPQPPLTRSLYRLINSC